MLRDPALIPLSQQHHNGLGLCVLTARALRGGRSDATIRQLARQAVNRYEIELANHFSIEELILFPLVERELGKTALIDDLVADHRAIEHMIDQMCLSPNAALLERFCEQLSNHIRREENELFQEIQQRLPGEVLAAAGREIDARAIRVCL